MGADVKQGYALLEAGTATARAMALITLAVEAPRDLTREEAAHLREHGGQLLCAALEIERIAMGIEAPRSTRG